MKTRLHLDQAQYLVGQPIRVNLAISDAPTSEITLHLWKLHVRVKVNYQMDVQEKGTTYQYSFVLNPLEVGNYGLNVTIHGISYSIAFDVVNHGSDVVRYGFLADFSHEETSLRDIEWMKDLHINAVQFYDWMFLHDQLISPEEQYLDPLGRKTSLQTIKSKIDACRTYQMRPFAYGAVYAATKPFFKQHPEWGCYNYHHQPLVFADWLHFMNVEATSGWRSYIIDQFSQVCSQLGFMGIHMDTYGFPKKVCNYEGKVVPLGPEMASLIEDTSHALKLQSPDYGVIFNAVNNWPIEKVAPTLQDATYIEVWPPNDTYEDIYQLIQSARLKGAKNVILAAYMKPFKLAVNESEITRAEESLLFTQAVIHASQGTQLVMGEDQAVLCDSYYVNYRRLRDPFANLYRDYADFIVRYGDLLYHDSGVDVSRTSSGGINEDIVFSSPSCAFSPKPLGQHVWTLIRESDHRLTIHFINLVDQNDRWNEFKQPTQMINDISIKLLVHWKVHSAWFATPDQLTPEPIALTINHVGTLEKAMISIQVPSVHRWSTVWIETD